MKRGFFLLVLVVFVIWLAHGTPNENKRTSNASFSAPVTAAAAPATDPCGGCDPNGVQEWNCITSGGIWHPDSCLCQIGCDPFGDQQALCFEMGGIWDPTFCYCSVPSCNPGPEVLTDEIFLGSYQKCVNGVVNDCEAYLNIYVRYCQNGTQYSSRAQIGEVCSPNGDPCGGGSGDCWYDLDCWCPNHGNDPDCEDYCYWDYCYIE